KVMSDLPCVFISFSRADQKEVCLLISALDLQNIKCWDYSDLGQDIAAGRDIKSFLAAKIDSCEYFIAVISPHSLNEEMSAYPRFEVQYALESGRHSEEKLMPILLNKPQNWQEIYPELNGIKWIEAASLNEDKLDDITCRICNSLNVKYIPPFLKDPKVFFAERFLREAEHLNLPIADFNKLTKYMNKCGQMVLEEKWEKAGKIVSSLLIEPALSTPGVKFYYPFILEGVFEIFSSQSKEGKLRAKGLETAERIFSEASEWQNIYDKSLLGLAFAGLGQVYFLTGRYNESVDAYRRALDYMPNDEYILANLINSSCCSDANAAAALFEQIDSSDLSPENKLNLIKIKGLFHYRQGEYETAVKIFQFLTLEEFDEAGALYYFLSLEKCGKDSEALSFLNSITERLKTTKLYHYLADKYSRLGQPANAICIYENFLCQPERRTRRLLIDYARVLKTVGNQNKMREVCGTILDSKNFGYSPLTSEDLFYRGYANYLLGKDNPTKYVLAEYDYGSSSNFLKTGYGELEGD
ncbi:MAG TPA: TIR domain-containing protein, partial [Pyrinomonadaceae bacterium]